MKIQELIDKYVDRFHAGNEMNDLHIEQDGCFLKIWYESSGLCEHYNLSLIEDWEGYLNILNNSQ